MEERSFSFAALVAATSPVLGRLLLVWGAIAIGKVLLFMVFGFSGAYALVFALMFGAVFFSAPVALSSLRARRRVRLLSRAGRTTLIFCFVWGAIAAAAFLAFLQLTQGMTASVPNYIMAMLAGGAFCSVNSAIPSRR